MAHEDRAVRERMFWERYSKTAINQGIKPDFVRWHVIRAQYFIKAFPGKRLADLGPDDITGYLQKAGHDSRLQPWQFRQVVDAIRILYILVHTDWAPGYDWVYWLDSAKTLSPHHAPTSSCSRRSPRQSVHAISFPDLHD